MKRSFEPVASLPFMTRTLDTTPRYWSNWLSKISACSGASGSPSGAGIRAAIVSSSSGTPFAGLGRDAHDVLGGDAEDGLDLHRVAVGIGRRQVDLVQDGDDLEVVLEREVAVGQGLRLDALRGVDDEDDAFTRGERAADLVAEVDVAGRVDQVEDVAVPLDPDVLGLDRDAPLTLEIHRVEVLLAHVARLNSAGDLEDAVGERRLAVVDVGDDREVADPGAVHGTRLPGAAVSRRR